MLSARESLARAQEHLASEDPIRRFYAALELRLGIESRLHEYRDAAERVATLKRRGWQIAHLAKDIERVFKTGDKGASFAVYDPEGSEHRKTFIYTPVRRDTRQLAERLGDYLHFTDRTKAHDEDWQRQFRTVLEKAAAGLSFAMAGTLLGPPMRQAGQGKATIQLVTEVSDDEDATDMLTEVGGIGENVLVKVEYFNELPLAGAV